MATVHGNPFTKGLSGTIGGMLVFRRVGSKTIASMAPEGFSGELSQLQLENRERFLEAVAFAKGQMADPDIKAEYALLAEARGGGNAYQLAVADFFHATRITEVDHSGYGGAQGGIISIRAFDDFRVRSVTVEILGPTGDLVERGNATIEPNKLDWTYTSQTANGLINGYKTIIIRAKDNAGNTAEKREEVSPAA